MKQTTTVKTSVVEEGFIIKNKAGNLTVYEGTQSSAKILGFIQATKKLFAPNQYFSYPMCADEYENKIVVKNVHTGRTATYIASEDRFVLSEEITPKAGVVSSEIEIEEDEEESDDISDKQILCPVCEFDKISNYKGNKNDLLVMNHSKCYDELCKESKMEMN